MTVFIKEVMHETQRVAILFALFTGLRIVDLNMEKQTFRVERNVTRVCTDTTIFDNPNIHVLHYTPTHKMLLIVKNTLKTKTSCREIPMSDNLCALVVRHIFSRAFRMA